MMICPAHILTCRHCGWSQYIPARGDVLLPHQISPEQCPSCGNPHLKTRKAGSLAKLSHELLGKNQ